MRLCGNGGSMLVLWVISPFSRSSRLWSKLTKIQLCYNIAMIRDWPKVLEQIIRWKWDSAFILVGLFKELLDLNIKLMHLISVPMSTWHPGCKQPLGSMEFIYLSARIFITWAQIKWKSIWGKLIELQSKAAKNLSEFSLSIWDWKTFLLLWTKISSIKTRNKFWMFKWKEKSIWSFLKRIKLIIIVLRSSFVLKNNSVKLCIVLSLRISKPDSKMVSITIWKADGPMLTFSTFIFI